jgi:hypothetical protein
MPKSDSLPEGSIFRFERNHLGRTLLKAKYLRPDRQAFVEMMNSYVGFADGMVMALRHPEWAAAVIADIGPVYWLADEQHRQERLDKWVVENPIDIEYTNG